MTYLIEMKKTIWKMSEDIVKLMKQLNTMIPDDNPQLMFAYMNMYNKMQLQFKQEMNVIVHNEAYIKNVKRLENLAPKQAARQMDVS